jgi:hypothetical protein
MIASNYQNWHIFHAKKPTERLLESRVRPKVPARFGGERLVFLDNQDLASYPTAETAEDV